MHVCMYVEVVIEYLVCMYFSRIIVYICVSIRVNNIFVYLEICFIEELCMLLSTVYLCVYVLCMYVCLYVLFMYVYIQYDSLVLSCLFSCTIRISLSLGSPCTRYVLFVLPYLFIRIMLCVWYVDTYNVSSNTSNLNGLSSIV